MPQKPYRHRGSGARGPILSPDTVKTYQLVAPESPQSAMLFGVASSSARYLGKLGMPEELHVAFTIQEKVDESKGEVALPTADYYIKASQVAQDEYDFSAYIPEHNGIISSAQYTIWQPTREGFVVPWGVQVHESSRTFYPRLRGLVPSTARPELSGGAAVSAIGDVITRLATDRFDSYRITAEQLLPEPVVAQYTTQD